MQRIVIYLHHKRRTIIPLRVLPTIIRETLSFFMFSHYIFFQHERQICLAIYNIQKSRCLFRDISGILLGFQNLRDYSFVNSLENK